MGGNEETDSISDIDEEVMRDFLQHAERLSLMIGFLASVDWKDDYFNEIYVNDYEDEEGNKHTIEKKEPDYFYQTCDTLYDMRQLAIRLRTSHHELVIAAHDCLYEVLETVFSAIREYSHSDEGIYEEYYNLLLEENVKPKQGKEPWMKFYDATPETLRKNWKKVDENTRPNVDSVATRMRSRMDFESKHTQETELLIVEECIRKLFVDFPQLGIYHVKCKPVDAIRKQIGRACDGKYPKLIKTGDNLLEYITCKRWFSGRVDRFVKRNEKNLLKDEIDFEHFL